MDEVDGWGEVIHGTNIALRFKSCVKHGINNSFLHQILLIILNTSLSKTTWEKSSLKKGQGTI